MSCLIRRCFIKICLSTSSGRRLLNKRRAFIIGSASDRLSLFTDMFRNRPDRLLSRTGKLARLMSQCRAVDATTIMRPRRSHTRLRSPIRPCEYSAFRTLNLPALNVMWRQKSKLRQISWYKTSRYHLPIHRYSRRQCFAFYFGDH